MGLIRTGSSSKLNLVSFDTSSSSVHLALLCGSEILASEIHETDLTASANSRQEAANLLMPAIDRMVREQKWEKSAIDAIVVGSGPGSFTGIRTSIVTSRALAQALMVPLLPVSLLQCYFAQLSGEAIAALQATVGFYFVAHNRDNEHYYLNEHDLKEFFAEHTGATRYGDSKAVAALQQADVNLQLLPDLENIAVVQGLIGLQQLLDKLAEFEQSGASQNSRSFLFENFNYEKVVPTYLRNPSVTIKESSKTIKKITA